MNCLLRRIDWGALLGTAALLLTPSAAKGQQPSVGPSDARLGESLDRRTVLRAALARNPAVSVSTQRADAMRAAAKAEGRGRSPPRSTSANQAEGSKRSCVNESMLEPKARLTFAHQYVLAAAQTRIQRSLPRRRSTQRRLTPLRR